MAISINQVGYAELTCRSNYTFLTGASHPDELVVQAEHLGLRALALTDSNGLYGVVKAHVAAKKLKIKILIGSEIFFEDFPPLTLLVKNLQGYQNLCRLITEGKRDAPKGGFCLNSNALEGKAAGLFALLRQPQMQFAQRAHQWFGGSLRLAVSRHYQAGDEARIKVARLTGAQLSIPLVAVNDVHTHLPERQKLQDILVCIREKLTLANSGQKLFPNQERTLKSPGEMLKLFHDLPEALSNTLQVAEACDFSLNQLKYLFPEEDLPAGHTAASYLRECVWKGAKERFGTVSPEIERTLNHELQLIEELNYPGYFLTLHSIVRFARERGILCQGRGSAANSAVCYCLTITSIDPVKMQLLFERFISRERDEPPDIDVDFEHERREEVIQHIYEKYGRDRAAMVCEVITYRERSALRDVAKVFGVVSPPSEWVEEIQGFPRHLSIHSGGFAITQGPIHALVPVEKGSMADRTVVQWDKDDLAAIGILKVDLLSLGMLTALRKTFELVGRHQGKAYSLATLPADDPATYQMIQDADTVGVFQIESRAQMSMLPRLKPNKFYDLVVEVAIVRPGPILGNMVHPYLKRRNEEKLGKPVAYAHPKFESILKRTLGVPIFQEQVMRLAMLAGFSMGEADELRRAMGSRRSHEKFLKLKKRFVDGLIRLEMTQKQSEDVFRQFEGFSEYGFPESHAASFALLTYASSYMKRHHPAAFVVGLLNSQPMGFYAPHTLIEDARRHQVVFFPVDVQASSNDCILVFSEEEWAVRLGFKMIKGLPEKAIQQIERARSTGPFLSLFDFWKRTQLSSADLARLAAADALSSLFPDSTSRRTALWHALALPTGERNLFAEWEPVLDEAPIPSMTAAERVTQDFDTLRASLEAHPISLMRDLLNAQDVVSSQALLRVRAGKKVRVAGMVIVRQRPQTANGLVFATLEDEFGFTNLVVMPDVYETYRLIALKPFLIVEGKVERSGKVIHIKAERFTELRWETELAVSSRDFH